LRGYVFGTSLRQLFLAVAQPLAVGIPYGLVAWWIAKSHTPWGWLGLAIEMVLTSLIYFMLAWLFVLNQSERQLWIYRFRMLFSRFRR